MPDMLVKLYELPAPAPALAEGVAIRKPLGAEHRVLWRWVDERFGDAWASEAQAALHNRPVSVFMALREQTVLGFACYDATARGLFGPIGVADDARTQGVGRALLLACLHDMRAVGYAYAVIGGAGPTAFFERSAGAVEISGSSPGLYRDMLRG
jgi:GNAT superfamily N-acetyltransferase